MSASFESDAATLDRVRVLTQQHHQSQSLLRRKEEQVSRLEQQVSDLTRVIEAQARSCDHSDAVQAEHERRERRDLEAIDALRIERDQQADARARAEHACRLEQSAHAQTKSQLKGVVDTQEAKWRAVTLELEAREAAHLHAEQQARVMREELESRLEAVSCAEADAQERVRALELQLRTAREQTAALDTKTKEVTADTEYLARGQCRTARAPSRLHPLRGVSLCLICHLLLSYRPPFSSVGQSSPLSDSSMRSVKRLHAWQTKAHKSRVRCR